MRPTVAPESRSRPQHAATQWPDADLEQASLDYDAVVLRIRESTGHVKMVRCEGYIAFEMSGFWDEMIIESAELL